MWKEYKNEKLKDGRYLVLSKRVCSLSPNIAVIEQYLNGEWQGFDDIRYYYNLSDLKDWRSPNEEPNNDQRNLVISDGKITIDYFLENGWCNHLNVDGWMPIPTI